MYETQNSSRRIQREIDLLPNRSYIRISKPIDTLASNPRPPGCVKVEGDIYRIRVGPYRVIYLVDDANQRIEIGAVHRRDESTYKNYRDLFK
ncbi:MAG: type II toxin-antitoxin system RelE/ParE family toxin [Dehalococcoidia bacterium]|nr:type II toxin-antitoxin system RelE/ParE family toxin [Dehalococcoidia bacterium]